MTKNYKFVLQENMYDCGVAALKTIFLQYGKKIKSNDVVRKTTSQGTTAYELISSSKKLGLNAKGVRTTLDTLTIKHLPCIAHIIKDKNYFHYIVIFEKNNINKTLVILDPAIGINDILLSSVCTFCTVCEFISCDSPAEKAKAVYNSSYTRFLSNLASSTLLDPST